MIGNMAPLSRGAVSITSGDPNAAPEIDHRFLSDPEGSDLSILIDGVRLVRDAAHVGLRELGAEHPETGCAETAAELAALAHAGVTHYYHPVGSCKMGTDDDAVVDARGRVHGFVNVYVGDCSIMPVAPRANTAIPAVVAGLRVGDAIVAETAARAGEKDQRELDTTTEEAA